MTMQLVDNTEINIVGEPIETLDGGGNKILTFTTDNNRSRDDLAALFVPDNIGIINLKVDDVVMAQISGYTQFQNMTRRYPSTGVISTVSLR